MSWYKNRGATGEARVFSDGTISPLTLEIAERAIEYAELSKTKANSTTEKLSER